MGNPRQTVPMPDVAAEPALTKVAHGRPSSGNPVAVLPENEIPTEVVLQARRKSGDKPNPRSASALSRKGARRQTLTRKALSCRGFPYRWGGSRLKSGVDCSGFTRYLYLKLGIQLPHSARLQFSKGTPVAVLEMMPGDLVFFNTKGPLTHVGMYIGDGRFVHASNPKRGINIDRLASRYYKPRFAGARRYTS